MVHAQVLFLFFTHCDVLLYHSLSIFILLFNDNAADNIFACLCWSFCCQTISIDVQYFFMIENATLFYCITLNVIDFCIFPLNSLFFPSQNFTTSVLIDLPWIFYNFILFFFSRFSSRMKWCHDTLRKFLFKKGFLSSSLLKLCKFAICLNKKSICMFKFNLNLNIFHSRLTFFEQIDNAFYMFLSLKHCNKFSSYPKSCKLMRISCFENKKIARQHFLSFFYQTP